MLLLFAVVAAAAYFVAQAIAVRQLARRRLVEAAAAAIGRADAWVASRRNGVESAWLKLVNSIERRGLSLVDTKDDALRQKLIAAGYAAPYAPRVYTLVRLVLVIGLPLLVLLSFWASGSSPSMIKLYVVAGDRGGDGALCASHLHPGEGRSPPARTRSMHSPTRST